MEKKTETRRTSEVSVSRAEEKFLEIDLRDAPRDVESKVLTFTVRLKAGAIRIHARM